MRSRFLAAGMTAVALAVTPVPASAAPLGTVEAEVEYVVIPSAGRTTTVAVCRAVASGTEPEVVAVATEVSCAIADDVRSAASPGPVAVTAHASPAALPFTICVGGQAAFLDTATNDVFTVTAVSRCVPVG